MRDRRVFEAQRSRIPEVMAFVEGFAEHVGLHPKLGIQLQLAVEEAVVNICDYAYETPPGTVEICLEQEGDRLTLELRDEGIPFDPLAVDAPDRQAGLDDRKLGGLGIFLIGKVVDEVRYRREEGVNVLTMRLANPR